MGVCHIFVLSTSRYMTAMMWSSLSKNLKTVTEKCIFGFLYQRMSRYMITLHRQRCKMEIKEGIKQLFTLCASIQKRMHPKLMNILIDFPLNMFRNSIKDTVLVKESWWFYANQAEWIWGTHFPLPAIASSRLPGLRYQHYIFC